MMIAAAQLNGAGSAKARSQFTPAIFSTSRANTNVSPMPSSNCLVLTRLFLCIQHKNSSKMATYVQTVDVGHLATADVTREVRRGLIARPRSLSPWDVLRCRRLASFERITTLPEYYPTRTERAILARYADAIIAASHGDRWLPVRLVELGAGTASKTCILLEAALRISDDVVYMPVDVCSDALELALPKRWMRVA